MTLGRDEHHATYMILSATINNDKPKKYLMQDMLSWKRRIRSPPNFIRRAQSRDEYLARLRYFQPARGAAFSAKALPAPFGPSIIVDTSFIMNRMQQFHADVLFATVPAVPAVTGCPAVTMVSCTACWCHWSRNNGRSRHIGAIIKGVSESITIKIIWDSPESLLEQTKI